ncbi:MAG: cation:proton antiporter [Sphingobacteriales bacterium JAD_PAG50586_3]|nr:MAG: cation:proton antiporter [Sphingobacteriales bacterium JAD_PAG50586_3]
MVSYPLIIIGALVIFSYLFDIVARKTKFPAVVLLLALGIGLQYPVAYFGLEVPNFTAVLPLLGTIGLILIVLEGSLELDFEREKLKMMRQSFGAALFILLVTALGITGVFYYYSGASFMQSFLNAVPFSIISSAIAIPSVAKLIKAKREFIVYESTFSDILGVLVFNFALVNEVVTVRSVMELGWQIVVILAVSVALCLLLLYVLSKLTHHVKFFLIISIILLIYGIGKMLHLPTLVIVMAFGLMLRNADLIEVKWFKKYFLYKTLDADLHQLSQLTAESAFIARTFFFLLFGFTMDVNSLLLPEVWYIGLPIIGLIFAVRFIYLRFVTKLFFPEFFIAPVALLPCCLYLAYR